MKVLHIPQEGIAKKNAINGIKTVLLEQVEWENKLSRLISKIYIPDVIEVKNEHYINEEGKDYAELISKFEPDIVIFEGFYSFHFCKISTFLEKKKIPYYIKPHVSFNKLAQENGFLKKIKKRIANKLFFNHLVKRSAGIIFLNREEKRNSIYHHSHEFILANGIVFDFEAIGEKKMEREEGLHFLFLGRIDFQAKGIDILLAVILRHLDYFLEHNIYFHFYGSGNAKEEKKLSEVATKSRGQIKLHSPVYDVEEKKKVYSEHDIFVLLSRYEGMPMSIIESLSIGIPCFVSEGTGMLDFIESCRAGWGVKENEDIFVRMKEAISEYIQNKEFYKKNAKESSKQFKWTNLIYEYEKLYITLCEKSKE